VDRIWLDSYPADVPETIDPDQYHSVVEVCEAACSGYAERPAFGNFGCKLTFSELDRHSRSFGAFLQHRCGLEPGERVALMMPNILAYPIAMLGAMRAGGVIVNTNPQYTARELEHQLTDAGAKVIVVFENALSTVAAVHAKTALEEVVVARIGDFMTRPKSFLFNRISRRRRAAPIPRMDGAVTLTEAVHDGEGYELSRPEISGSDLAFLQYTGGTTGRSKAAMLTHRNIVANILQVVAWFGHRTERGHEIVITALPLYHIYALTGNCFAFLAQGCMNYLITDPRDIGRFVSELKRVPFTAITGVNTLFNELLQHPKFSEIDFTPLKFSSGGGMAVQRAVAERWEQVTGSVLAEGYGLTESSPVVAINRFDVSEFTGCIGLPVPSTEIKIVDDNGEELAVGEVGELCVRGPQVMQGYWNNPEETRAVLDDAGWLRTGDVAAVRADGYIRIVDRKKDLILVSGFNVYPNEIEDVAVTHPAVNEVAAIGVPDDKSNEAVKLVVVRTDDSLSEQALIDYCREQLTAYKVPRRVEFVDELPKSNVGKILRREVREKYGG
jgi:long-chain acyl-CoA synthetase